MSGCIEGVFTYDSTEPGPSVVIIGGIHGNEPCGLFAIESIQKEIESGARTLRCGSLTLVRGNLLAIEKDVRYVDYNLNRLFKDSAIKDSAGYEVERVEQLKPIIQQADFQLDLHSTRSESEPFLMAEPHLVSEALEFYDGKVVVGFGSLDCDAIAGDTELYGHKYDVKSFTMENGEHYSKEACKSALRVAQSFLSYTKICEGKPNKGHSKNVIRLETVVLKSHDSFQFARKFSNFTPLKKGELIAIEDGQSHYAPYDCNLVILCDNLSEKKVGEELYFLARTKDKPSAIPHPNRGLS